ncbi:hypothetical protein [Haloechinothrix sp. LS1_15]|uniref:hypothetical protein n=1 Tax=Haloechinothrix sp. LS1_15 TaxID=2652248 RepID=UPI0029456BF1|nr:hypothetical protein [Haloechinothrix sp. LS1_15]MDV6013198.1 hypothetical protein [Haloechinothrix sp. LS1_15]
MSPTHQALLHTAARLLRRVACIGDFPELEPPLLRLVAQVTGKDQRPGSRDPGGAGLPGRMNA